MFYETGQFFQAEMGLLFSILVAGIPHIALPPPVLRLKSAAGIRQLFFWRKIPRIVLNHVQLLEDASFASNAFLFQFLCLRIKGVKKNLCSHLYINF